MTQECLTKRADQLRSSNYISALIGVIREDVAQPDHVRDPIYFGYKGFKCHITGYVNASRCGGSKYVEIRDLRHNYYTLEDSEVFRLKPLGYSRQQKIDGLMKDNFELPQELARLYSRFQRMVKSKHKNGEWLDVSLSHEEVI